MKPVDVLGIDIEVASGQPLVLLREQDPPHRVLPMFIGRAEAAAIALGLSGETPPRPLTHDLLVDMVNSLDAHVDLVEVTGLEGDAFVAELSVRGPAGSHRVDSRPSDAIAVAMRLDAPIYVRDEVMDEAGAQLIIEEDEDRITLATPDDDDRLDDGQIEDEVARFRSFLDDVEPSAFDTPPEPPSA